MLYRRRSLAPVVRELRHRRCCNLACGHTIDAWAQLRRAENVPRRYEDLGFATPETFRVCNTRARHRRYI